MSAECVDDRDDGTCRGEIEFRTIDGRGGAVRCDKHWADRLDRYNDPNSLERYANSDVPPPWFDPTLAGERWDDDY